MHFFVLRVFAVFRLKNCDCALCKETLSFYLNRESSTFVVSRPPKVSLCIVTFFREIVLSLVPLPFHEKIFENEIHLFAITILSREKKFSMTNQFHGKKGQKFRLLQCPISFQIQNGG